ncbi:MAG: HAD family hydrolase [Eubacteriales bacterium]|nr:HAD family hydrolase [Eubacteriales bacterium]
MGKIVFFDVDGTIYHNSTGVVRDAAAGIRQLRANGHRAFICTGRSRAGLDDDIVGVGFDGIVASCGTYIEVDGQIIKNETLPEAVTDHVIDTLADREGYYLILEGSRYMYMGLEAAPPQEKKRFTRFVKNNAERIKTFQKGIKDVNKFCLRLARHIDYRIVEREMSAYFDALVHTPFTLEFVPHGYDKGTGIDDILRHYGMAIEDTVGFGDGVNDVPMLKRVETAIVMGNGSDAAKAHADYVTKPILEGGIGHALERLSLI